MRRITKKVRDEAALICSICASAEESAAECGSTDIAREHLGYEDYHSAHLAYDAWDYVYACLRDQRPWLMALTRGSDNLRELYAEAEALLRTGWLP